ncbi:MAG TPA: shikimate kinase [Candidatus Polarisedimenticolia bacterium]|jgi:shikimate kinase|nr:shikimate kinase [Candidatus Polarisedimenticolia bacterium]
MARTAAGQVYLVGFMGAGKTTAGRHLSSLLGWEFADLDEMICLGEGRSIPEIFREKGEPHFRLREREALIAVTAIPRLVVATGGGTYVAEENRNLVEAAGWSVWLQVSLAEALRRAAGGEARPLMASRAEVEGLFRFRQEFYRCARLRIDTERLPPGKVAPAILESLLESGFQPA